MSWFLAFLGFVLLVILHEAGHFTAAKAVGMRVERFALFFPPLLVRKKVGETEYAIGAIPAGGYVKISGMNPDEKLPDEVRTRAYYAQPPWKRVVVIAAGPLVNLVIALVLLFVFFWQVGPREPAVGGVAKGFPAQGVLKSGDRIVAVDGHPTDTPARTQKLIAQHRCKQQPPVPKCQASSPARVVIERDGRRMALTLTPVWDAKVKRMRLGFAYGDTGPRDPVPAGDAADTAVERLWEVSKLTVALPLRIFDPERRKEIGSAVGGYEVTRQSIKNDPGDAIGIIALISLSLAIVNLYPFLPLDGGHIFWAIVEKIRRRPVPFSVMERASVLGFGLVMIFFFVGLTNDISRLTGEGFQTR
ncbi:MAG TPA: M50 family metallopeptidase [Thermoleophilaceae bacterium]|nr:M50 family metallopeptidase [Thermoleophilaceae bacterium]